MRNILSFPLAFFAVILCLGITACGDDDSDGGFTSADLSAQVWNLDAITNNLAGKGAEVAAAFTEAEIDSAGFDTEAELAAELDLFFAFVQFTTVQDCDRETDVTFNADGTVTSLDACNGDGAGLISEENSTYTWSLNGQDLAIVEVDEFGDTYSTTFDVVTLNSSTLELRVEGNDLLTQAEYETEADPDINITYVFTAQ